MRQTILYFAYGSNMSTPRLRARVPSARKTAVATLARHRLVFHKVSLDGSAKCDALETGDPLDVVHGVVFELPLVEQPALDHVEGLGQGYGSKRVSVSLPGGDTIEVFTYCATHTDSALRPYTWYREHVLRGAREHGLPADYIAVIESVPALTDTDSQRQARELALYPDVR